MFLIHYDRRAGKILSLRRFEDADRRLAETARLDLEVSLNRRPHDDEVVILDAESEEHIRKTHGRYFYTVEKLIARSGLGE